MRNLNIYLVLLLCLFASKMLAQDPSPKGEQEKETFEQAMGKFNIKYEQIKQEEERKYNEEVKKLKMQRRKGTLSKQEFKDQEIVLKKKRRSNINERSALDSKNLRKQFPEMGAKTFEDRAKMISIGIQNDIFEEKDSLKKEIEAVDKQLIEGSVTKTQAEEKKLKLAETRAKVIESNIAERQKALSKLAQDEIEGKLPNPLNDGGMSLTLIGNNISQKTKRGDIDARMNLNFPAMKAYKGQKDKDRQQNKRTSSQLVFAIGANNVVTDGVIANSDFKYLDSRFYEWGFTFNSRIIPNDNLLHAKYGLSMMYNNLKSTNNRVFVDNGRQTVLETDPLTQKDSRFRNVNLVVPLHLEFDFTKPTIKDGKTYFKSHNSFRLGMGGYFGVNLKSKQVVKYSLDGYNTFDKTKGDFNTSNFIYGLSTYVGYKETSLYLKYDLNPLFKDNVVKHNNVSLGLRFDFN
jgi:hypothetical protein